MGDINDKNEKPSNVQFVPYNDETHNTQYFKMFIEYGIWLNNEEGMGRLSKLEEGVGEISNMYIRPKYRGKGYGKEMLKRLEEKAREFGYSMLRLDTMDFNAVVQHIYRKAGYKEIGRYKIGLLETEATRTYFEYKKYMEKKL